MIIYKYYLEIYEQSTNMSYTLKVTVQCRVSVERNLRLYVFEKETKNINYPRSKVSGHARTIPTSYTCEHSRGLWQQEIIIFHLEHPMMELLRKIFGWQIISNNSKFSWPICSPYLMAPNLFLREYLNDTVYHNKPWTIHQFQVRKLKPIYITNSDGTLFRKISTRIK